MATKKDTEELTTAINRLVASSERLEDTTYLLLFATIFLFVITFTIAIPAYNYPGGMWIFLIAVALGIVLAYFIIRGAKRKC
ncbi:MAG: hypothetical protein QXV17_12430 [Candidatus Micrarchaeaceae archaeon]